MTSPANKKVSDRKRRERDSQASAPRFNNAKFVQYELDKEQQKECKAYELSNDELFDSLIEEISNGYQFTLKWDDYNECYGVFMSTRDTDSLNFGFILTGRGSTPAKCLKQVLYKHRTCLAGEWGSYVERRGRDLLDD